MIHSIEFFSKYFEKSIVQLTGLRLGRFFKRKIVVLKFKPLNKTTMTVSFQRFYPGLIQVLSRALSKGCSSGTWKGTGRGPSNKEYTQYEYTVLF